MSQIEVPPSTETLAVQEKAFEAIVACVEAHYQTKATFAENCNWLPQHKRFGFTLITTCGVAEVFPTSFKCVDSVRPTDSPRYLQCYKIAMKGTFGDLELFTFTAVLVAGQVGGVRFAPTEFDMRALQGLVAMKKKPDLICFPWGVVSFSTGRRDDTQYTDAQQRRKLKPDEKERYENIEVWDLAHMTTNFYQVETEPATLVQSFPPNRDRLTFATIW